MAILDCSLMLKERTLRHFLFWFITFTFVYHCQFCMFVVLDGVVVVIIMIAVVVNVDVL